MNTPYVRSLNTPLFLKVKLGKSECVSTLRTPEDYNDQCFSFDWLELLMKLVIQSLDGSLQVYGVHISLGICFAVRLKYNPRTAKKYQDSTLKEISIKN